MKDYLFRKNLSVKQMAGDLNISTSYLYQLMRGERRPSAALAQRIETITSGEVTLEMLLGIEEEGMTTKREWCFSETQSLEHEKRISHLENVNEKIEERLGKIESRLTALEGEVSRK
jgi:transcriptional regulator with XRE-family HTH domain